MAETAVEKIVKVSMTDNGYDHNIGKMRKGGVYEMSQEQAVRYVRAGVAKPAAASAKLAKDEDRERFARDARERQSSYNLDQEMSAAWDIDVRDLERAELEAEAAHDAADRADDAIERAAKARKVAAKAPTSPEPGPVNTQGEIRS